MIAVTAILLIMAALIVPNLVGMAHSRSVRDNEEAIERLPAAARIEAQRSGAPVILRIQDNALVMERCSPGEDPLNADQTDTVLTLQINSDLRPDSAQEGGKSVDTGAWKWIAYPDGSAEVGGLTFTSGTTAGGTSTISLMIPARGEAIWSRGELPPPDGNQWPAGTMVQSGA
jgi:type II secretory pathway pseudopilin PulG